MTAYVDVAYAEEYTESRGFDEAELSDELLLVASEWIDGRYGSRFPGRRAAGRIQDRAWPRVDAVDNEGYPIDDIPDEVKEATVLVALRVLSEGVNSLSVEYTPGKRIASASVDGAVSVTYADIEDKIQGDPMLPVFSEVEAALWPILVDSSRHTVGIRLI